MAKKKAARAGLGDPHRFRVCLMFTRPGKPPEYGKPIVRSLDSVPVVGDCFEVDDNSSMQLLESEQHCLKWRVISRYRRIRIEQQDDPDAWVWHAVLHPIDPPKTKRSR